MGQKDSLRQSKKQLTHGIEEMGHSMEYKRTRKGIYEVSNGMVIERHYTGGEKAWYIYKDGEVVTKKYTLDNAKLWIERNYA